MKGFVEKITEEQETQIDELVERVLQEGGMALEVEFELFGSTWYFRMPEQEETEYAMDESGRDARGLRDAYTREMMFSRLILSKALVGIDDIAISQSMARRLLARLQPDMVRALFLKYVTYRDAQSIVVAGAVERTKKSQPDPVSGSNGRLPD